MEEIMIRTVQLIATGSSQLEERMPRVHSTIPRLEDRLSLSFQRPFQKLTRLEFCVIFLPQSKQQRTYATCTFCVLCYLLLPYYCIWKQGVVLLLDT